MLVVLGILVATQMATFPLWTVPMIYLANALGAPPVEASVGFGPTIANIRIGGVPVRIRLFPLQSDVSYVDAARRPPAGIRLLLALFQPAIAAIFAFALLGTSAVASITSSVHQLPHIIWPFGDGGRDLILQFESLVEQSGILVGLGALYAKLAALTLVFTLTQPFLWFGGRERVPMWTPLVPLIAFLLAIFVVINLVRAVLA